MKTKETFILITLFLAFTGFQPVDRKEKKLQQEKEMTELIESGHFRFVASSAKSSLGYFNNLGSTYDFVFDSLMLKAYLPYYGRAYSVSYGSEGGVKFNLNAKKIKKVLNEKKKMFSITTEVSDSHDLYLIFLTAGTNGFADLQITFNNREMISYYGVIEKLKKVQ